MDASFEALRLFEEVKATAAGEEYTPHTFVFGGGVLLIGFLVSVILELRKLLSGETPSWSSPILRLILFSFLLGSYALIAQNLVMFIAAFGDLDAVNVAKKGYTVFAARAEAFGAYVGKSVEERNWIEASLAGWIETQLATFTFLSYSFTAAVVYVLKLIQKVMLATLIHLGPLMIGFAAIPGLTARYLTAWFLSVIEVSAWGIVATTLLRLMGGTVDPEKIKPELTPNLPEHIAYNLLFALAFAIIPVITASILRGGGAAGVAAAPMAAAKLAAFKAGGFAAASMRGAKGAAAGGAASAAGGAGSAAASGARAGDAGAGARRSYFARDGAIRKQERERSGDG